MSFNYNFTEKWGKTFIDLCPRQDRLITSGKEKKDELEL